MKLIGFILFLTVLEAVHEGLRLRANHVGLDIRLNGEQTVLKALRIITWAGIIEMIKLAGMVVIIILCLADIKYEDYFWYQNQRHLWLGFIPSLILGWAFIRYAIFDFVHNACAGLELCYVGKTKLFDKFFNRLLRKQEPTFFFWWTRVIFLLVGLSLIIKI